MVEENKNIIDIYVDGSKTIYELTPVMSYLFLASFILLIFYIGYYFGSIQV